MNPRYMPGGDKYEAIRADEQLSFYERVREEKADILVALRLVVSNWTEREIDAGYEPVFEKFRDEYPEWDYEELYATISEEMERVIVRCRRESITSI